MTTLIQLQNDKRMLEHTRIVRALLREDAASGEVLLRVDRLAATANNVTYAAFGDVPHLSYWSFFPTGEEGWGHMPAWGFADVVASGVKDVSVGERFFGYWPIASHLRVEPARVNERRFFDGAKHRQCLTSIYNQYTRTASDPSYRREDEDYIMLLRPLFLTSSMLADFLLDQGFFGTRQLLVSSASSKTAYGTAFCLRECFSDTSDLAILGLTSPRNRVFVERLGCYTDAVAYPALEQLDARVPTVYVDFSGDAELRARVHHHFGASLAYDCFAGSAQSHAYPEKSDLPGPTPRPYFAPTQVAKRNADWGPLELARKLAEWERAFIDRVQRPGAPWIEVREHRGFEAARELVENLCAGRLDPLHGHALVLS